MEVFIASFKKNAHERGAYLTFAHCTFAITGFGYCPNDKSKSYIVTVKKLSPGASQCQSKYRTWMFTFSLCRAKETQS
jgi:hypothetical protein